MSRIDNIRNEIIDKLLTISDEDNLMKINLLVEKNAMLHEKIKLSKEQKLMLEMSESDIIHGRVISQKDLDKNDLEWLKGK
jgi:hypothetical protein